MKALTNNNSMMLQYWRDKLTFSLSAQFHYQELLNQIQISMMDIFDLSNWRNVTQSV